MLELRFRREKIGSDRLREECGSAHGWCSSEDLAACCC